MERNRLQIDRQNKSRQDLDIQCFRSRHSLQGHITEITLRIIFNRQRAAIFSVEGSVGTSNKENEMLTKRNLVCAICAAVGFAAVVRAEPITSSPLTRVTLQTLEMPDGKQFIQQLLEGKPDLVVPRHTHPGIESSSYCRAASSCPCRGRPIASSRLATAF
jgi:hypothetical protein